MDYNECKQALYNSDAMENIPDSWKEEVPIIFEDSGIRKIGFLFSIVKNGKTKLKRMIAVSLKDIEVTEYTIEQLKEKFKVNDQYMEAVNVTDYDEYFLKKEKHESMLSDIASGNENMRGSFVQLTKELFSNEQYKGIVLRIGTDFYK